MRFFSASERAQLLDVIDRSCRATELLTGCSIEWKTLVGLPPVVNHGDCIDQARLSAESVFGADNVIEFEKIMGADNFGCYLQEFQAVTPLSALVTRKKASAMRTITANSIWTRGHWNMLCGSILTL